MPNVSNTSSASTEKKSPLKVDAKAPPPKPPAEPLKPAVAHIPPAQVAPKIVANNAELTQELTQELGDFWHTTVQALIASEAINAMAQQLALQSQLVERSPTHWRLQVERDSLINHKTRLHDALREAGHDVPELIIETAAAGSITDNPTQRNQKAAQQRQEAAEAIIHANPFVQSMVRDFGASIKSIKPL